VQRRTTDQVLSVDARFIALGTQFFQHLDIFHVNGGNVGMKNKLKNQALEIRTERQKWNKMIAEKRGFHFIPFHSFLSFCTHLNITTNQSPLPIQMNK